ncbi:MAG: hypothetical protein ABL888_07225 [Pirellulaceae bacterium]
MIQSVAEYLGCTSQEPVERGPTLNLFLLESVLFQWQLEERTWGHVSDVHEELKALLDSHEHIAFFAASILNQASIRNPVYPNSRFKPPMLDVTQRNQISVLLKADQSDALLVPNCSPDKSTTYQMLEATREKVLNDSKLSLNKAGINKQFLSALSVLDIEGAKLFRSVLGISEWWTKKPRFAKQLAQALSDHCDKAEYLGDVLFDSFERLESGRKEVSVIFFQMAERQQHSELRRKAASVVMHLADNDLRVLHRLCSSHAECQLAFLDWFEIAKLDSAHWESLRVRIIDLLTSEYWKIRMKTIVGIGRQPCSFLDDDIRNRLAEMKSDVHPQVRAALATAINDSFTNASALVEELANDSNENVRHDAVRSFAFLSVSNGNKFEFYFRYLEDQSPLVSAMAGQAIVQNRHWNEPRHRKVILTDVERKAWIERARRKDRDYAKQILPSIDLSKKTFAELVKVMVVNELDATCLREFLNVHAQSILDATPVWMIPTMTGLISNQR